MDNIIIRSRKEEFKELVLYTVFGNMTFVISIGSYAIFNVIFGINELIANALAWILIAPVLDILIYAEPVSKVFAQGFWAFLGNIIVVGILGSLLAAGYSRIGAKSSSLSKED